MNKATTCLFALAVTMLLTGCQSPLNQAVMRGDTAQVQQLLDKGADINAESYGYTPLMIAARSGNTKVVEQLLGKGANVNATIQDGNSALTMAANWGQTDCVKVLLEHGANPDQKVSTGEQAGSLISLAAANTQSQNNKSALDLAREKGYTEIVQLITAASRKGVVTPQGAAQPALLPKNNTGNQPF